MDFWSELYKQAAAIYAKAQAAGEDVAQFATDHPEIVMAAQTLAAMLPAPVQQTINVAEEVWHALQNMNTHAQQAGVHNA